MGEDSGPSLYDRRDEDEDDDDDDDEESEGGNRLLGFMFGNVDNAGDLDVDYLDEEAKEHLAALAEKLGSSLTDIDLSIKSSHRHTDVFDQDYDEKAEDAVDYEDIDEQYEGPEIQATSEEDHLLPKKDYFSAEVSWSALQPKTSVFDEENYDEDEDFDEEPKVDVISEAQTIVSADDNPRLVYEEKKPLGDLHLGELQEDKLDVPQEPSSERSTASLPVLYIEDGRTVLRFSEIFGIHEPIKKVEKRSRRYTTLKERFKVIDAHYAVEEDEEAFLRGPCQDSFGSVVVNSMRDRSTMKLQEEESHIFDVCQEVLNNPEEDVNSNKYSRLSAEPMKESITAESVDGLGSPSCPTFCPLDQQDWEGDIVWGNSPLVSHGSSESCIISEVESEEHMREKVSEVGSENSSLEFQMEEDEKCHHLYLASCPVVVEPFGSRKISDYDNLYFSEKKHPQQLRLESCLKVDDRSHFEGGKENGTNHLHLGGAIRNFSKLPLQNLDLLEDAWLDNIIWDPDGAVSRPKLILDLQDTQMLFEIPDSKDVRHLQSHAGAMIVTRSSKQSCGDLFDQPGQMGASAGRFNISNDKYYSNRKSTQQLKSHSKKRTAHGVKVLHSTPAWKLQTMKPKLSNKDIANFHRPKALWYPHDNEMALKEQGKLSTQGPMKIILKSMGGKGSKLHVDAEETVHSVKAKASKKLDLKPSEEVKIIYSGKELEDNKSLAEENVRPNSILHLVRTKIHLWPKAQKLPGENKALRPPGAFKKKSELSLKDGHVFLMEYCEERPLLLGNVGMGARLCTYYQKYAPGDQTGSVLRNENSSLGNVLTLDPADKSPFLGDIRPGSSQSCIETNLYRAPIFPHKLCSTDYLLVRSAKGKLSLRRIDRVYVVGQQEPHMEVMSPGTKGLQTYIYNRLLVYIYREFGAMEKRGLLPRIRADELSAQFPNLSEPFVRKRLKQCADLQRQNGHMCWVMKRNFRIPLEEELRRMVTPENVCAYESMQAGHYRLKRQGISRLTHPTGLSYAMNQLPDEAIALAAASHIERELQITPWNLSSNFVACTNQDRENIERLEITGVGDPTGRGLGFSYVRVAPKAPLSSAVAKKKTAIAKGGPAVTGTDADLRRLSMEAAREVLLKFKVPEEQIAKQTRWHRIAMIRKLSSEQAASGVKVDSTTIGKYARGQRMSFLQLQQQTREKCQEIWDRQVQSLSAADEDENDSDSEANSDLDSFAGDLENLLDAEECGVDEEGNYDSKHNKEDGIKGLKMRRHPSQPQAEEEIEDEAAEAAELCRMLMDEDESNLRKKKKTGSIVREMGLDMHSNFGSAAMEQNLQNNTIVKKIIRVQQPDGSVIQREQIIDDPKEVELILAKRASKAKSKKGNNKSGAVRMALPKNKDKVNGDGFKFVKEKKQTDKPVRESFVCGACGQVGHMRTNKNCPRYGEDTDTQVDNVESGKVSFPDLSGRSHQKTSVKKLIPKGATRLALVETSENSDKAGSVTKVLPLKFKCGPGEKISETFTPSESQSSDKQFPVDIEAGPRSVNKISRIIISNKDKPEDVEPPKVVIKPPAVIDRDKPRKKIIIKQPKGNTIVDLTKEVSNTSMQESYRKTISISELSSLEKLRKQEDKRLAEEAAAERKAIEAARLWEEEERRRKMEIMRDQRRLYEEEQRIAEEQRLAAFKFEAWKMDREQQKSMKKKRKKEPEIVDKYMDVQRSSRDDRTFPGRNRSTKRRSMVELGKYNTDIGPQTKRRRGAGEVGLANILETVVEGLKEASEVSYLFLKPVSKKEAPDYLDIIEHPMDLSTIKEKVRKLEYKSQEDFRHDVWQITLNAHQYNAGRNPGIPPLADQLLELCDYLLDQNRERLEEAEAGIDSGTTRA